jgi:two-component system response regulator HydG
MGRVMTRVSELATGPSTVVLWGEAGSGKQLVARAIHDRSPQADGPFITVSARRFAEDFFGSAFFRQAESLQVPERESYPPLVARAVGGSLLLRQLSELSFARQVRLLRALASVSSARAGSEPTARPSPQAIRLFATTSSDLAEQINRGQFRLDAIFRLNLQTLFVPPLRRRREDLVPLAERFLAQASRLHERDVQRLAVDALDALLRYQFPGNVRELESLVSAGVMLETSPELRLDALPAYLLLGGDSPRVIEQPHLKSSSQVEKEHIEHVLRAAQNNRTIAAKILGISRVSLISKIKIYRIDA